MLNYLLLIILVFLPHSAQDQEAVQLNVRLRSSDGTAVVDETVVLESLSEEGQLLWQANNFACRTNNSGECSWFVPSGLYQVLFTRPLDDLSALALAEGGLSGFGLTVGEADISYHFTFHSDGRVYFDAAPDAVVPAPIVPEAGDLHPPLLPTEPYLAETVTPPPSSVFVTNTEAAAPGSARRLFLFVVQGLTLGITLHFLRPFLGWAWSRIRANRAGIRSRSAMKPPEENKEA